MLKTALVILSAVALARAQLPLLGWCPEFVPMANFDMAKFLGTWYEAERYFQISEVASRCAMANYTKGPDNKYRVSNQVTNRFTGIKRILEGEIKPAPTKAEAAKLYVKYTTVPLDPETSYAVLETDYKSYAVLWSCNSIGPLSAQNAWIMTRERRPPGEVLQSAYGVLDRYKISKTFFVKADQADCDYELEVTKPLTESPVTEQTEALVEEAPDQNLRAMIVSDALETTEKSEEVIKSLPVHENLLAEEIKKEKIAGPVTVAEIILKTADISKETTQEQIKKPVAELSKAEPVQLADQPIQVVPQPNIGTPIKGNQQNSEKKNSA